MHARPLSVFPRVANPTKRKINNMNKEIKDCSSPFKPVGTLSAGLATDMVTANYPLPGAGHVSASMQAGARQQMQYVFTAAYPAARRVYLPCDWPVRYPPQTLLVVWDACLLISATVDQAPVSSVRIRASSPRGTRGVYTRRQGAEESRTSLQSHICKKSVAGGTAKRRKTKGV